MLLCHSHKEFHLARVGILTAVLMKIPVFLDIKRGNLEIYTIIKEEQAASTFRVVREEWKERPGQLAV